MKIKVISIMLLLSIVAVLAGCQATPEKDVVVNKKEDYFENDKVQVVAEEQEVELQESWKDELDIADVKINIDADIDVPDTGKFPVTKVKQTGFDQNTLKQIIDYFAKDENLYHNASGTSYMTKELVEQIVVDEKLYQNTLDSDNVGNIVEKVAEQFGEVPSEKELDPVEVDREMIDTVTESIYFDGGKNIPATFVLSDERAEFNRAYVACNNFGFYGAYTDTHRQDDSPNGVTITKEQAIEIGKSALDEMGFDYMDVSDVQVSSKYSDLTGYVGDDSQQCYSIFFSRTIDNVKSPLVQLYAWNNSGSESGESESFRKPWTPEYIWLNIDDTGILSFRWQNPVEVVEIENENVPVLTSEEIKEKFKEKMQLVLVNTEFLKTDTEFLKTDNESGEELKENKMEIDRIVLGNQFVPVRDVMDEYRLMPCWIFYGTDTWLGDMSEDMPTSQLMLNAIDGEIL